MRIDLENDRPGWMRRGLAGLYGAGVRARCGLFRQGVYRSESLPAWVISVGNLVVGGTGKTPTAAWIARHLAARGWRVAVLNRGYRGRSTAPVNIVSDGSAVLMDPEAVGDEAVMLARALDGVPVIAGRDRRVSGRAALDRFGSQVLLLDDGYQHIRLARDRNLLLLDARRPWGNGRMLPAGPLREPVSAARRATAFLITRADGPAPELERLLAARFPGRPLFHARHRPVGIRSLNGGEPLGAGDLAGRPVAGICGLARPESFFTTLQELGARVVWRMTWPDHYRPGLSDWSTVLKAARRAGAWAVLTTAKDAVKLERLAQIPDDGYPPALVLEMTMDIPEGEALLDAVAPPAGWVP